MAAYSWTNLEDRVQFELDGVIEKEAASAYSNDNAEACVECMDYTSLKVTDTESSIAAFVSELVKTLRKFSLPDVASVCVFPCFAPIVKEGLAGTSIKTAVVGACFPAAHSFLDVKLAECREAVVVGADEVDVVLSVGDVMEGNYETYFYNRQLIGLYKEVVAAMLLKQYEEKGDNEHYDEMKSICEQYMQTRIGDMWLKNMGIVLGDYPPSEYAERIPENHEEEEKHEDVIEAETEEHPSENIEDLVENTESGTSFVGEEEPKE